MRIAILRRPAGRARPASSAPDARASRSVRRRAASRVAALALGLLAALAGPAAAHEFWIEAEDYRVEAGEPVRLDLLVGQGYRGNAQSFNPARQRRTALLGPEGEAEVTSRIGDRPAIDQPVPGEGLLIAVHETNDSILTYRDRAIFETFVAEEGLDGTLERHAERGLPEEGFREAFSRSVKALVGLGGVGAQDRALGLPVEIVVEGDPYAEPMPAEVTLLALADGEPMAGALVNVFTKPDGGLAPGAEAGRLRPRADETGRVTVPLEPGTRYLANVVDMREASPELEERTGAVWESRWGSTTFSTGE